MEIAEQQQGVVQAAVKSFAAERAAWQRERERLAREVQDLRHATREAVQENLAGAASEGVVAVRTATGPLLGKLTR